MLIGLVVICLLRPYWRYSYISYIFREIGVDLDFCLRHNLTEKRTSVPNKEFVAISSLESVVFVRELVCATLQIGLDTLN